MNLTGQLHHLVVDRATAAGECRCREKWLVETEQGEFVEVRNECGAAAESQISGQLVDGALAAAEVIAEADQSQAIDIGIFRRVVPGVEVTQQQRDAFDAAVDEIRAILELVAGHRRTVTVAGYWLESDCNVNLYRGCEDQARAIANHHRVVIWGGVRPGYQGLAFVGGTWAWVSGGAGLFTLAHEIFHTLGLRHAARLLAGGALEDRGDHSTLMGRGLLRPNGLNMAHLGLIDVDEVDLPIGTHLVPVESEWIRTNESRCLCVATPDGPVWISTRQHGIAYGLNEQNARRVFLHAAEANNPNRSILATDPISEGESVVFRGIRVEFVEALEDSAVLVFVTQADDSADPPVAVAGSAPDIADRIPFQAAHSGLWAEAGHSGQGFDLIVDPGRVVAYWFALDAAGEPVWFVGGMDPFGRPDTDLARLDLEDEFGVCGWAEIAFTSERAGVVRYWTEQHGRGQMQIRQFARRVDAGPNGGWHRPDLDKHGLSVGIYGQDGASEPTFSVAYWFEPGGWMMLAGPWNGAAAELIEYDVTGGLFRSPVHAAADPVGSGALYLHGEGLRLDWESREDFGSIDLERLA